MAVHPLALERAERNEKLTAAIAYWAVAVVFVANVAVLNGWLPPAAGATPAEPAGAAVVEPTEPAAAATSEPASTSPSPSPTAASAEILVESGASVVFPVPPRRSEDLIVIEDVEATLVLYTASLADGTTYSLGLIEYPNTVNVSDPAVNLVGSVTGAAGNVGGRVVRQRPVRLQGAPAITFRIAAESVTLQGRNVLDNRFLYAQNIAFKGPRPPDAGAFFRSLRLP